DILADLSELRAHVALAHHVAVDVPRELARDKDQPLPFHHDDVGIQDTAVHDPLGQRFRLDVLSVHGTPPSRSLLRSPEATAPLSSHWLRVLDTTERSHRHSAPRGAALLEHYVCVISPVEDESLSPDVVQVMSVSVR